MRLRFIFSTLLFNKRHHNFYSHNPLFKESSSSFYLSPHPSQNASFVFHKFLERGYQQHFVCVKPTNESADWNYSGSRWHSASTLKTTPRRPLSLEEISRLEDIFAFYVGKDLFLLIKLSDSPHVLVEYGLFRAFSPQQISISFTFLSYFSFDSSWQT